RYDIFGSGGAKARAADLGISFLGEVPIQIGIRITGDEGRTAALFDDPLSGAYLRTICENVVRGVTAAKTKEAPLPTLTV
ncbi:MAG: ATP-binding protein, partial [Pirellulales bacterium]